MFSSPRLRHHVGDDRDALLDGALVERGVAEDQPRPPLVRS
jgi:hypothetical protein